MFELDDGEHHDHMVCVEIGRSHRVLQRGNRAPAARDGRQSTASSCSTTASCCTYGAHGKDRRRLGVSSIRPLSACARQASRPHDRGSSGDFHAAEHARKFVDALFLAQNGAPRSRCLAVGDFADAKVVIGEAGDLRQVRNAQYLAVDRQVPVVAVRPFRPRRPPTPLSTSSKTIVGIVLPSLAMTWIARLMRDNSPPDATRDSGIGGCPGLALIRNSISSMPQARRASSASGVTLTRIYRRACRGRPSPPLTSCRECLRRLFARLRQCLGELAVMRLRHPATCSSSSSAAFLGMLSSSSSAPEPCPECRRARSARPGACARSTAWHPGVLRPSRAAPDPYRSSHRSGAATRLLPRSEWWRSRAIRRSVIKLVVEPRPVAARLRSASASSVGCVGRILVGEHSQRGGDAICEPAAVLQVLPLRLQLAQYSSGPASSDSSSRS